MKIGLIILGLCLCLPAAGADKDKPLPKDFKALKALAEKGDAKAQNNLGVMYDNGKGVMEDDREAGKWFRKAAEQGYATAQSNLGVMYAYGKGVLKDDKEAVKWFRKAAEQGDSTGQFNLGVAYGNGEGVSQNFEEAVKWYRKAAEQGNADAQHNLGLMYANGKGVLEDDKEAVRWYRKAAEQGYALALLKLGLMYFSGEGVLEDNKEAVKWVRKAAEQGLDEAQFFLGGMYFEGSGVLKDDKEAVKWYRKAAQQGYADAQYNLGGMYFEGEGVLENHVAAYAWWNIAAFNGNASAKRNKGILAKRMTAAQIAMSQELAKVLLARIQAQRNAAKQGRGATQPIEGQIKSTGTGFFITDDGYILTNHHVIDAANSVSIKTAKGVLRAKVVRVDKQSDLAVLKVEGKFKALPIVSSRKVGLGDEVFTVGFPQVRVQGFLPKLTSGRINSLAGIKDDPRNFQISVPIQPGNSGGPLVNEYGNVVGVVVARLNALKLLKETGSLPQNVNYAVKSSFANSFLESLPKVVGKLKEPHSRTKRKFSDAVKEVQAATVLILVR